MLAELQETLFVSLQTPFQFDRTFLEVTYYVLEKLALISVDES